MTTASHDPSQPDPMAERRRRSTGHYDAVDAIIDARPKAPTHVTTVTPLDDDDTGIAIAIDDGNDTTIVLRVPTPGRLSISLNTNDTDNVYVELSLHAAGVLTDTLRKLTGRETVAPITGHR